MGYWRIGADELATSRFAISPLIETVAALLVLARGQPTTESRSWYVVNLPAYQAYVAQDPTRGLLIDALLRPRWVADFLSPPPADSDRTFTDAVRRVRATPRDVARTELQSMAGDVPLDRTLRRRDLPADSAALLQWVWTHTVRAEWPRRRHLLEADVIARTHQLSQHGWAAAINGIRPGMRWIGDNRLQINTHDYPTSDLTGAHIMFVPCTGLAGAGWVSSDTQGRHAVVYPAAGVLADAGDHLAPQALARLLGPVRADLLTRLATPHSTTQLVAITGYGLGSVGGHLTVLRDAGLIRRRRAGRSVLYYRSPDGDRLLRSTQRR
jgi:DNA-binding transcriptional ArsR family regulator